MKATWSATAYKMAIIHGRQQQTAMPMTQASATQKTTKNTSNPRKIIQSLQQVTLQKLGFHKEMLIRNCTKKDKDKD